MEARMAEKNDILGVTELRMRYFDYVYGDAMSKDEREELMAENLKFLEEELGKSLYISIVEEEGKIVASAYMTVIRMAANMRVRQGRYGEIYGVYTDIDRRRKGYAGMNIRKIIEEAEKLSLSYVCLEASPEGADLYLANGFKDEGATYRRMQYVLEEGIVL